MSEKTHRDASLSKANPQSPPLPYHLPVVIDIFDILLLIFPAPEGGFGAFRRTTLFVKYTHSLFSFCTSSFPSFAACGPAFSHVEIQRCAPHLFVIPSKLNSRSMVSLFLSFALSLSLSLSLSFSYLTSISHFVSFFSTCATVYLCASGVMHACATVYLCAPPTICSTEVSCVIRYPLKGGKEHVATRSIAMSLTSPDRACGTFVTAGCGGFAYSPFLQRAVYKGEVNRHSCVALSSTLLQPQARQGQAEEVKFVLGVRSLLHTAATRSMSRI